MRRLFICTLLVCAALASCGGSRVDSRASNAGVAANSNTKISFGVYDISKRDPVSVVVDALRPAEFETATLITAEQPNSQERSLARETAASVDTSSSDRKIIRNAELDLESEKPEEVQQTITSIAEQRGGFVVESQQSSSDLTVNARDVVTMTVRVPAEAFGVTLADIRYAAGRVVAESVKGLDVTEEFIDIDAQLRAKKALEQQFMEIMKSSNSVEDALNVQTQLASVRAEIERIEGRKRYLENQSAMSTIRVRLQTPKMFAAASAGFGSRLGDAFGSGFNVAVNFVLGLVTFVIAVLPFVVLVCLPAFVIIRYFWRRQIRPRSVMELAQEELGST